MAESVENEDDMFTAEEIRVVYELLSSVSCDAKLLESINTVQQIIWRGAVEDGKSPCRQIAAMSLVLLRAQKAKAELLDSCEISAMKAMFESLSDETKARLPLQSLDLCLQSLRSNQPIVMDGEALAIEQPPAQATNPLSAPSTGIAQTTEQMPVTEPAQGTASAQGSFRQCQPNSRR